MEPGDKGKAILAKAVGALPKSVKIWLAASKREQQKEVQARILRRALETIPNSERLWKELIELEGAGEAKVLLHKAVECIPSSLDFWLALAKLEDYDGAREVLNRARQALPSEAAIWVYAAKLEESEGKPRKNIYIMIEKGLRVLRKNKVKINRDEWLNEAMLAETAGNVKTSQAIIKYTTDLLAESLEDEDKERIWLEEADTAEQKANFNTARAIYGFLLARFPLKRSVWVKALEFERRVIQLIHKGTI